jgi:peptidoglycan-associated lipoprotein
LKKGAPAYLKYRDYKLVVEGHCDERGTAEYNLALGEKRATEAAKYLSDLGIEKERIKTISYGKEMPLDQGHDEAAWAKNRRAHFVIFPPVK